MRVTAGPAPVHTDAEPVAWGDLAFTAAGDLLVPRVDIVTLEPDEAAHEQAHRRAWLERPTDEVVGELVRPDPGEGEAMLRFRRWLARRYVEWLKANPEEARRGGLRRVRAITLQVLQLSRRADPVLASVPLWQGDAPATSRVSRHGGLGTGSTETYELANVWAGVLMGARWLAAWAWVKERDQQPLTVIFDPGPDGRPGRTPRVLEGVRPLAWMGPDTLLAQVREDSAWHLAALSVDDAGTVRHRRALAPAPSPNIAAALIPGARRAVLARGFVLHDLDLAGGRLQPLRVEHKMLRTTLCGLPLAARGAVWLAEGPVGTNLLALTPTVGGWRVSHRRPLPWRMGADPWCSPLAEDPDGGLILGRAIQHRRSAGSRATAAATTGWLRLHRLPAEGGPPVALPMDPVHALWGSRPVAISPDGRWLAARMDTQDLRVWRLDALLPRR